MRGALVISLPSGGACNYKVILFKEFDYHSHKLFEIVVAASKSKRSQAYNVQYLPKKTENELCLNQIDLQSHESHKWDFLLDLARSSVLHSSKDRTCFSREICMILSFFDGSSVIKSTVFWQACDHIKQMQTKHKTNKSHLLLIVIQGFDSV